MWRRKAAMLQPPQPKHQCSHSRLKFRLPRVNYATFRLRPLKSRSEHLQGHGEQEGRPAPTLHGGGAVASPGGISGPNSVLCLPSDADDSGCVLLNTSRKVRRPRSCFHRSSARSSRRRSHRFPRRFQFKLTSERPCGAEWVQPVSAGTLIRYLFKFKRHNCLINKLPLQSHYAALKESGS